MANASYVTGYSSRDLSSKSVVIKNISPETREEDIIIYFQRKRNGGGEVDCVRMLGEGTAVITFEKTEVAESVMNRRHEMGDRLLTLEPAFRQTVPYQVFGKVSGRLDPNTLGIDFSAMKAILQTIQDEEEVEWKEIFDGFVVSGTFEQMKGVNDVLKKKFKERKVIPQRHFGKAPINGQPNSAPHSNPIESEKCSTFLSQNDQLKVNQNKRGKSNSCTFYTDISGTDTGIAHGSYSENNNSVGLQKLPSQTSENNKTGLDEGCKIVDSDHSKEEAVFSTYIADITMSETRPNLAGHPPQLTQETLSVMGNKGSDKDTEDHREPEQHCGDKSLVQSIGRNNKESCNVIPQYLHLESLDADLQSTTKLSEKMKSDHSLSNTIPALNKASSEGQIETVKSNECVREVEATANGRQRHENGVVTESHWKFLTSTGVTATLLVGDMIDQHVDVLLCPANATLSYDEGLSKLIMDKGGQAIKDECLSITRSKRDLEGATFITHSGNLPCKAVLYAVLPSWNDEMHDEKTTKRQIHKCLMEGLRLASGYRLKSIALPPLGQPWNDVPVKVSAEVFARVVAAFGKAIGPMHNGITDFYIVCEDEATISVFAEEFSSFSFKGQTPVYQSVYLTNHPGDKAESQTTKISDQNRDKVGDPSIIKETVSVKQTHKEDREVQSGPLVSSTSALQLTNSPKEKTGNEGNQDGNPITSVNFGKKLQENQTDDNQNVNDPTANCERQVCEKTLSFVPSSCIQRTEVSMVTPIEILEVKDAIKLSEERIKIKHVVIQGKLPSGKNATTFLQDKNLHMNQREELTGTYKSVEGTVGDITKDIASNMWRQIKDFAGRKEEKEDSQDTNVHDLKGIINEQTDRNYSPSNQHTFKSSSSNTNSGIFITSPTVDGLLNADLRLGFQGLEIWGDEEAGDHSHRSAKFKEFNEEGKGSKSALEESPSSSTFLNTPEAFRRRMPFDKTISKSRSISEKTEKEKFQESVRKDDVDETKKEDNVLAPGKNYNPDGKRNVSKYQLPIPCALCPDSVDHPDLTHPSVCQKHKFCDDCILKAFTISSCCPACKDTAGLIINEKENVNEKIDFQSPGSTSSFPPNQDDNSHWTATPDPFKADQPPGQVTWKKYEASLPGFVGVGTIEIKFVFYEGTQSSEHPNPGKTYRGTSCVAYIPDTLEGKEVFKLLRKAFDARLVFTVSTSISGTECVTLSHGIELKTSTECNARNGYPDRGYLSRVRQQLAVKGIR